MIVENDRRATLTHDFIVDHEYEVVVRAIGPDDTQQAMENAPRGTIVIQGKTDAPSIPTALTAEGFLYSIVVSWTNPTNYDLKHVEVWQAVIGVRTLATKIAEVKGTIYTDALSAGSLTRYYWLRAVNTSGQKSEYTEQASATSEGVPATSIDDFSITATKLFTNAVILDADSWTNNSPGAGSVAWNGHNIVYNGALYPITAGNTAVAYIYWTVGDTTYSTSATHPALGNTKFMIAINTAGIHTLVWNSAANMVIGSAYIADAAIIEAKIGLLAVTDAKIANGTITSAKISDLTAGKITAGTIRSKQIVMDITAGTGDCAIRAGKTDFTNAESGWIIGMDDSDADKPKLYIGDATTYLNWTGSALAIKGTVTITGGSGIASLTDAGALAVLSVVGNAYITDLDAGKINAGTLTGRTVQTDDGTAQRIVMDQSDNTLKMYDAANQVVLTMDDTITAGRPGISITDTTNGGVVYCVKDGTNWATHNERGVGVYSDEAFSANNMPLYVDDYYTGAVNDAIWIKRSNVNKVIIKSDGTATFAGNVGSSTGFYKSGTKVVGAQGAAVADATDADDVITQLNALLARCRAHGLINT